MVSYRLRALEPGDLDALLRWENDPAHWVVGQRTSPYSRDSLKRYIAAASADFWEVGQIRFVLCTDASDEPLGLVDVFQAKRLHRRAEVGVLIDSEQRGKGLAGDHLAAQKAFERAGFTQIGCWKNWVQTSEGPKDVTLWQWLSA
ncbi:MAG: N-acetyltransferase [Flavobacteriia bacterium]|nr:N-acetyltransferase [Flavobacteriia bacterium]